MALIPAGVSISETIDELNSLSTSVRRKTKTLVDYYIYPNPTPSEISAYDPRLAVLQSRLNSLSKINYTNLAYLLDVSDALTAAFLKDIIDQLLNAIHGIQEIFQNHYDRFLEVRKPFETIYRVLELRETQLTGLIQHQMADHRRLRAEDLRPNEVGYFCRGAIQMINKRDKGKVSYVDRDDLLEENKTRMRIYGGAFLWWECQECSFRLRFHVSSSVGASLNSTNEVRDHPGVAVEYKSRFLIKSHLYQISSPGSRGSRRSVPGVPKYGCVFCFGLGKRLEPGLSTFSTGRELATHIASSHKKNVPPAPMAEKFNVAIKGRPAENVYNWDINFK